MFRRKLNTLISILIACAVFSVITAKDVFAVQDYIRNDVFIASGPSISGQCVIKNLDYWPWESDFSVEFDNPLCIGWAAIYYQLVSGVFSIVTGPAVLGTMAIVHEVAKDTFKNTRTCGSNWKTFAPLDEKGNIDESFIGNIPPVVGNPDNAERCEGNDCTPASPNYMYVTEGPFIGSYKRVVLDWVSSPLNSNQLNVNNKYYREWIYNGKEYEDDYCNDPRKESLRGEGTSSDSQRYYMRGYESPNFACERFIYRGEGDKTSYQEAYDCCIERSQNTICIEREDKDEYKFCELGTLCSISPVTYKTFESITDSRNICAKTWSLCPYNHNIGGGTELEGSWNQEVGDCQEGNNATSCYGQPRNFCQLNKHCVQRPILPFTYESDLGSKYFDTACMDFKGDSRNTIDYSQITGYNDNGTPIISWADDRLENQFNSFIGKYKGFTAPIAQCIKESVENIFYNRAGHSVCSDGKDPVDDVCENGNYYYKKGCDLYTGECLDGTSFLRSGTIAECDSWGAFCSSDGYIRTKSVFSQIQEYMSLLVKIIITLALVFYGYKILLTGGSIKRNEVIMFLIKIGFIAYFVTGNAWQEFFVNGVTSVPADLTTLVLNESSLIFSDTSDEVETETLESVSSEKSRFDGCFFSASEYPTGKKYLALWDTLDCKIARYIGYGPSLSVANIALAIVLMTFSAGAGAMIALGLFIFAFFIISIAVRAIHIFLMSIIAIIVLLYISPIIIPMLLFKPTKGVFDNWLNNLIGFALQPVILSVLILVILHLFDMTLLGSATFAGNNRVGRVLVCNSESEIDSILCILNFDESDIGKYPGAQAIGIIVPFFSDMSNGVAKLMTIVKAAFLMFILAKLLDQIPGIASSLAGGAKIESKTASFTQMHKDVRGRAGKIGHKIGSRTAQLSANVNYGTAKRTKSAINTAIKKLQK